MLGAENNLLVFSNNSKNEGQCAKSCYDQRHLFGSKCHCTHLVSACKLSHEKIGDQMEKNYMELKIRVAANFLCRQKPNTIDIPVNKSSINYDS